MLASKVSIMEITRKNLKLVFLIHFVLLMFAGISWGNQVRDIYPDILSHFTQHLSELDVCQPRVLPLPPDEHHQARRGGAHPDGAHRQRSLYWSRHPLDLPRGWRPPRQALERMVHVWRHHDHLQSDCEASDKFSTLHGF